MPQSLLKLLKLAGSQLTLPYPFLPTEPHKGSSSGLWFSTPLTPYQPQFCSMGPPGIG